MLAEPGPHRCWESCQGSSEGHFHQKCSFGEDNSELGLEHVHFEVPSRYFQEDF